jgi:hypothetical protein
MLAILLSFGAASETAEREALNRSAPAPAAWAKVLWGL